jgi:hypothetical protein
MEDEAFIGLIGKGLNGQICCWPDLNGLEGRSYLFPLAEIFFCLSACLSGQTGGGQSSRQTLQLGLNFKGLPNKNY